MALIRKKGRGDRGLGKWLMVGVALCPVIWSAQAQEFAIRQISREQTVNSEPVISETGLAAWMYYATNDVFTAHSHIAVFQKDERIDLTDGLTTLMYGAGKPQVDSNHLVFIANYKEYSDGDVTWVLREAANRDEGEIREVPALYKASEEGGVQKLEDVFGQPSTNEVVPVVGIDTNVARRQPSGAAEIWSWHVGDTDIRRVSHDNRNDFSPSHWGNTITWQKAKGWPFGWEIMALVGDTRMQLTTNYFYDLSPKAHGNKIVWYGWDGFDYEIYLFDSDKMETIQLTDNRYDDVAATVWGDVVVWEGYAGLEADIFIWKDGVITKISDNLEDDLYPRIWNNKVVWQGFDDDDFEIYFYDIEKGGEPIKLTSNNFDDTNPEIRDDLVVWMGYHDNWDAEIFYVDVRNISSADDIKPVQLTANEEDDRDPDTAGRRIVWVSENSGNTHILLAEPK
jgi:beta propeller repeat protein